MKQLKSAKDYILITLLIIVGGCGIYVAEVLSQYDAIVRGILGIAVLCLIYLYSASLDTGKTVERLMVFPENLGYFARVFVWSGISYWAADQIYKMVLFIF